LRVPSCTDRTCLECGFHRDEASHNLWFEPELTKIYWTIAFVRYGCNSKPWCFDNKLRSGKHT
jgi:hypothetical protein